MITRLSHQRPILSGHRDSPTKRLSTRHAAPDAQTCTNSGQISKILDSNLVYGYNFEAKGSSPLHRPLQLRSTIYRTIRRRSTPHRAVPSSFTPALTEEGPTHPEAVNMLIVVYCIQCLIERTWRFALPLVLANVAGGYKAIAIVGFASPLANSLLGPAAGRLLDRIYRPYGLGGMVCGQGFAIVASGLVVLAAATTPGVAIAEGPLFAALLVFSMMERLTAIASELAIERDWVTQLAGRDNAFALARSNAYLRRSDLSMELVGAIAFGWLYKHAGVVYSVGATAILTSVLLPIQLFSISRIAHLAPEAMVHGRDEAAAAPLSSPWKKLLGKHPGLYDTKPVEPLLHRIKNQIAHSLDGWKSYVRQPILISSLTFVILFFNVALSPGGLITAFLTAKGLDGTGMAMFRAGCATMGFTGTWVGRRLIRTNGLLKAGIKALLIQAFCLTIATITYCMCLSEPILGDPAAATSNSGGAGIGVVIFVAAVVSSRIGMWSFDMVNAQLFQQAVSQREVASASAAEMALCSFSELLMLGLAAWVISPEYYSALALGSLGAVFVANLLFNWWARQTAAKVTDEDSWQASTTALLAPSAA